MTLPDAGAEQPRDGIAVVDKDAGWTSHDVVAKARGILKNKKIGHAGTLDPDATGVLILGVGRVTRLMRFITPLPKVYECEIVLGASTTTLDASGEVTASFDMSSVTPALVVGAAAVLTGEIMQVPPMVSAVKVGGERLYKLAREGKEIDREARPVTVHRFEVRPVDGEAGIYRAEVECSSGTYIRSLAADLGTALGGGAHLRALRRSAVGSFTVAEARPLDKIEVLAPSEVMRDYQCVTVGEDVARSVGFGKVLGASEIGAAGEGPWGLLDPNGDLLAVYEALDRGLGAASTPDRMLKPAVVLRPAP